MALPVRIIVAVLLFGLTFSPTHGAVVYNELDGELSGVNTAPTDLGLFMPGVNSVTGQVTDIGNFDFFDPSTPDMNGTADIFTFEIPDGAQLDSIILESFATAQGGAMFLALDDGPTFEFSALDINSFLADLNLIRTAVLAGTVGENLLTIPSAGGSGSTPPLGPGQYSVYIQEQPSTSDYSLSFNVSAATSVPESSSVVALSTACLGFFAVCRARRRKRAADTDAAKTDG